MLTEKNLKAMADSIESGAIAASSRAQLIEYNAWLCDPKTRMHFSGNYEQVCETVRVHLLRVFMEDLERKSSLAQRWFMVVAVISMIGTISQVYQAFATTATAIPSHVASQPAAPPPLATPIPAKPTSSNSVNQTPPAASP